MLYGSERASSIENWSCGIGDSGARSAEGLVMLLAEGDQPNELR